MTRRIRPSRARRPAHCAPRGAAPLFVCARLLVLPGAPDPATLAGELGLSERVTPAQLAAPAAPADALPTAADSTADSDARAALADARAALAELRDADADAALTRAEAACRALLRVRGDAGPLRDVHLERAVFAHRRGDETERDARLAAAVRLDSAAPPDPVRHPPVFVERWHAAHAALTSAEPASVTLRSDPPGAAVWLDGRPLPRQTPATLDALLPGTHHLRVSLPGWRPWYARVELEAAGHQRLDVYLEPARDAASVEALVARALDEVARARSPAPALTALAELAQADAVFAPGGALYGADGRRWPTGAHGDDAPGAARNPSDATSPAGEADAPRDPEPAGLFARWWWLAPVTLAAAGGITALALTARDDSGYTFVASVPCASTLWPGACGGARPALAQALARERTLWQTPAGRHSAHARAAATP